MAQPWSFRRGSHGVTRQDRVTAARSSSPMPCPSLIVERSICCRSCLNSTTVKPKHCPISTKMMLQQHRNHLADSPSPHLVSGGTWGCWPGYRGMLVGEEEHAAPRMVLGGKARTLRQAAGGRRCLLGHTSANSHPDTRKGVAWIRLTETPSEGSVG